MGGLRIPFDQLGGLVSLEDMDRDKRELFTKLLVAGEHGVSFILTSASVLELASFDHWIYVTDATIDDKSKASPVQKGLVLLQVLWMATQCISRASYGLPITLLELHTWCTWCAP